MKYNFILIAVALFGSSYRVSQPQTNGHVLVGVFDGRTPCKELANQLQEKVTDECIKIKWRVTLYKDSLTGKPSHYEVIALTHKKGNPRTGSWRILKGTRIDPQATVYELQGKVPIYLQKADDNILFFLDENKRIRVGNYDFSYALNRKQ
jgi:hypothetical protein